MIKERHILKSLITKANNHKWLTIEAKLNRSSSTATLEDMLLAGEETVFNDPGIIPVDGRTW